MSAQRTLRKVHYWLSPFLIITVFVIAVTGSLLALKKDFDFLQAPVREGASAGLPERTFGSIVRSVNTIVGFERLTWRDIDRIDIRPKDGIAKVILMSRAEVQVDLMTGSATHTGYRTSDLLETIHDFSFLGGWAKYVFSFGSGIAMILMAGTGVYLFALPMLVRGRKRIEKQRGAR